MTALIISGLTIVSLIVGISLSARKFAEHDKAFEKVLTNDLKHIRDDIADIKQWMHKKSEVIDDIKERLIVIETGCKKNHNGGT